jgi:tRNA threonylcarbamoyladenosine biosynthesis protein TsaB
MNESLLTLAIETSTRSGTVALLRDDLRLGTSSLRAGTAHGRELAPALNGLLDAARLEPGQIDLVATGIGPGSYTGLRVGVATALGFSLATECSLVGVPSLAAKALEVGREGETLAVAVDAGGEECYYAVYRVGAGPIDEVQAPALATWQEVAAGLQEGWVLAGEGGERLAQASGAAFEVRGLSAPQALYLGRLGRHVFLETGATAAEDFRPLYLRKSRAEINWESRQKRD